ncbi:hypothetical protein ACM64Y_00520 [Novispirillum sp. DQ9]|uniref:hypothetical protein n=1 Tax=Novispirillum sp. DQ9 TaxID=3398612 RepID=UPI003C7A6D91
MALSTSRDPDTLAGVYAAYAEILTVKRAAFLGGVSEATLYRSANPEDEYACKDIVVLMALDRACVAAGHPAPFLAYWGRCVGEPQGVEQRLEHVALEVQQIGGALAGAVRDAVCPGGDGGAAVTAREAIGIKVITTQMRAALDVIDRSADAAAGRTPLDVVWSAERAKAEG